MSPRYRGDEFLEDIVVDLRNYQPLVDELPDAKAIYQAYSTESDERDYPLWVTIEPAYGGSTHQGAATRRTFRVQANVKSTIGWRKERDRTAGTDATRDMLRIMFFVADRMEVACGINGLSKLEGDAGGMFDVSDGERLAIINDWPFQTTQTRA